MRIGVELMNCENLILQRFPENNSDEKDKAKENPAIRLYGKRYYKDQTPVEYLAEFLLVFASPKKKETLEKDHVISHGEFQFYIDKNKPSYYPEDKVALKLFSFFSNSKLETRHPVHRQAYMDSLKRLAEKIDGDANKKKKQSSFCKVYLMDLLACLVIEHGLHNVFCLHR